MVNVSCVELPDEISSHVWEGLIKHVEENSSEIITLNEMPLVKWHWGVPSVDVQVAIDAANLHEERMTMIGKLGCKVITSKPIHENNKLYNEAFLWDGEYKPVHTKHFFPEEPGFFEDSWFSRKPPTFDAFDVCGVKTGVMLCTEMWFDEHARLYGKDDVQLIAGPRATETGGLERWKVAFRHISLVSGAFTVTSNRVGVTPTNDFCGYGCIVDPNGTIIAHTSREEPFITRDLDFSLADEAKKTYPRYVREANPIN